MAQHTEAQQLALIHKDRPSEEFYPIISTTSYTRTDYGFLLQAQHNNETVSYPLNLDNYKNPQDKNGDFIWIERKTTQ